MPISQYRYGNLDRVAFKLTKNGIRVAGYTFSSLDVKTKIVNGSTSSWNDISSEIDDEGEGWYSWQPTSSINTEGQVILINIKDNIGTDFDENGMSMITGGDSSARLNGT